MRASYVEFQDVLDAELREIEKRRAQTGLPPLRVDPTGGNETTPPTGLALSGGGPRSACIGLGLLQALYRSGLLRHLDYLSTVSGGGYVGSYLSSWVTAMDGKIEWSPEQKSSEPAPSTTDRAEHKGGENGAAQQGVPLPFYAELNAPQPAAVRRMAGQGEVLRRP
ncbi:MAG TPA: patatin-like phospholipase family protein, partial [Planctomicrobium sp.]|nr:patatin-like phospholipase family protein [Planctomicrobium sp.]